jgi:hypothetical protein
MNPAQITAPAVFLAAVMLSLIQPARAQEIPRFDVNRQCRAVASVTGAYSEAIFSSCIDMEQNAYDSLKADWAALSDSMKAHCTQVATVTGPGSYAILRSCIEMENDARSRNQTRQFRY